MKSLHFGELGDKLEAAKGQVTKIDRGVGWASAAGLRADTGCQSQQLGPPVCRGCAARWGRLRAEKSTLWTHSTFSVTRGMELIMKQIKHCFYTGIITCNFWTVGSWVSLHTCTLLIKACTP